MGLPAVTAPIVPVTGKTPIYELEYLLEGEPAFHIRQKWQRLAQRVESLLQGRGLAPQEVLDGLTVLGRVSTLESAVASAVMPLTMLNGWQNYGGAYQPAYYAKVGKLVVVNFMVKTGTPGTVMAQLPLGARPAGQLYPLGLAQNGASSYPGPVLVYPDGTIVPSPPTPYTNMSASFSFIAVPAPA